MAQSAAASGDTEHECTEREATCRPHPQAKADHEEFAGPLTPPGHRATRHATRHHLSQHPPEGRACPHGHEQPCAATGGRHAEKGHHGKGHHKKEERHDAAHGTVDQRARHETSDPQPGCDRDCNKAAAATHRPARGEDAARHRG